ncbi:hypothetical protein TcWFU_003415 [Taenia crassiceps]|uniref:Uncharacterized protein n=1 Tax=Taenia crassiceps TaxID=6207 RepID=A0ABR4Q825_9CEST
MSDAEGIAQRVGVVVSPSLRQPLDPPPTLGSRAQPCQGAHLHGSTWLAPKKRSVVRMCNTPLQSIPIVANSVEMASELSVNHIELTKWHTNCLTECAFEFGTTFTSATFKHTIFFLSASVLTSKVGVVLDTALLLTCLRS